MNISAKDIHLSYGAKEILKGVDIHSENGEFVGLIGPNGSGKSTLLKCIYRILKPNAGQVFLDEEELRAMSIKESARKMGVVAQHNYYNFEFTVREVVMMGRAPHKKALERDNAKDYEIVEEALKTVGMEEFAQRSFFHTFRRRTAESDPGKSAGPTDALPDPGRAYQPPGHYSPASAYADRKKSVGDCDIRHS